MPQQLIYTSAQRGIVAGRSGHCTVARSAAMREALMLQLEKLSYYQHLSLSGGQERPIFTCRIVDIRGTRFHVLSRIQDAGLDFTGRTNFIAHHLIFTPEEIRQFSTPPVILRDWPGWLKSWTKEPQLLEKEDWAELTALSGKTNVPAQTWQRVTGDAVNGYGLLEARAGASFRVDDQPDETVLELLAESLELLEVRDTRRDFRTAAWNYTFTTSMQEQDNPADFRWRCIHSDNPAANRFSTPDCRALSAVRATKCTGEETAFARIGRQPPRFVEQPQNQRIKEGDTAAFTAKAEGIPTPNYQWFECDRDGKEKNKLNGQTSSKLVLGNCKRGTTRFIVWATNGVGNDCRSVPVKLDVDESKQALTISKQNAKGPIGVRMHMRKQQLDVWEESEPTSSDSTKYISGWWLITIFIAALIVVGGAWWLKIHHPPADLTRAEVKTSVPVTTPRSGSDHVPLDTASNDTAQISAPRQIVLQGDHLEQLPPSWNKTSVGKEDENSSVTLNGSTFVLKGNGENIFGKSDNFFFVYQNISNSVEFAARLSSKTNEIGSRRGIMMRESKKAEAPFVFIGLSQMNIFWVQRHDPGANCTFTNLPVTQLPISFKINRKANTFSGAFSTDGTNWTGIGTNEISMPDTNYLAGFAVCSGKTNAVIRADFDKVSIRQQISGASQ